MLQLQDQGNLVIYKDIWETGTVQSPNNGSLSPISCTIQGNNILMNSNLPMGSCLTSPSGRFALNMQTDGNLVLYDRTSNPARALWNTVTQRLPLDPLVAMKTLYFYDALGNLYCVEQHGTATTGTSCPSTPPSPTTPLAPDPANAWRRRMFGYDSLSRLLWASNPESGIIQYLYDADGNLLQKTSPAPNQTGSATQSISYCYDALHRVTKKDYQAHTFNPPACPITAPVVTYTYDVGTNGVGRLTSLTDQAGSGSYTYDPMGRILTETRVISGVSRTITYGYNLDGSLKSLQYPSNRVVNYTVNAGSRVTAATDANGTQYVVNSTSYPPGEEYQRSMPGISFRTDLNSRLQVSGLYSDDGASNVFISKSYNFGPAHQNNGNVVSIINNKDSNRTQSFTYDPLNRITAGWTNANTGALSWGENYTVDAWGNLQIGQMSGKAHGGYLPNASTAQNQMTGMWYDAPGNMTGYTAPSQYSLRS